MLVYLCLLTGINQKTFIPIGSFGLWSTYGGCCSAELESEEVLFWDIQNKQQQVLATLPVYCLTRMKLLCVIHVKHLLFRANFDFLPWAR